MGQNFLFMTAAHFAQPGGVTVWSMRATIVTACSQVAHW
jgi:hypothetical protein